MRVPAPPVPLVRRVSLVRSGRRVSPALRVCVDLREILARKALRAPLERLASPDLGVR